MTPFILTTCAGRVRVSVTGSSVFEKDGTPSKQYETQFLDKWLPEGKRPALLTIIEEFSNDY